MSRTYFGIGNNKLGFAELQKAYTEGDSNVSTSALWESAYMHRELHQYDLALAQFGQVIKLGLVGKQRQAAALFERAAIYQNLNRQQQALADLNEFNQTRSSRNPVSKDRANTFIVLKKYKEALADLSVAIELAKNTEVSSWYIPCLGQRSLVYRCLGQNELASKDEAAIKAAQVRQFDFAPFRSKQSLNELPLSQDGT